MRPRKFYLGFPPALVKKTRGGVEYGIGAIPLGGYVKIPGMHRPAPGDLRASLTPEEQETHAEHLDALDAALERGDEETARGQLGLLEPQLAKSRALDDHLDALAPDAYWRQTTWKRIVVIGAGPMTNIVFALVLFTGVFMSAALETTRTVQSVLPDHPAAAAGLRAGDRVSLIAGHRVTPDTISSSINATHGRPFTIVVVRAGRKVTIGPLRARLDQGAYRIGFEIKAAPGAGRLAADRRRRVVPPRGLGHAGDRRLDREPVPRRREPTTSRASSGSSATPRRPTGSRCATSSASSA